MTNKYYNLYLVGGIVRDRLLGVQSKDIDYSFEFTPEFLKMIPRSVGTPTFFYITMNNMLKAYGFEIFLETIDCFTTRARFPKGHEHEGITADFVMCRKETYEDPESRQPTVSIGTLYDDLLRRDFTVNAIAQDEDGNLIDPFGGQEALKNKVIECPVDAETSFMDDPLRMLRALRFMVTKDLFPTQDVITAMERQDIWNKFDIVVSRERVRDELFKMFYHNPLDTISVLTSYVHPEYLEKMVFKEDIWLKPTTTKR
jgi:tRNA nucleotidyltransferase/poly(A) polymerase